MTSSAIRQSFLDFFREKQHTIVPSSSLLPDAPNLLFTNAGMNQFVPIFLGQAPCPYSPARAADTQKCIRAGGKHNDLEDVGFDTYHHTMFEMLGNWSFGNYFKKEAIEWAWELVVKRWGFPPSRVYATIYSPGEGDPATLDREAHEHWSEIFIQHQLDPAYHVVHGNKKDNFWMMGETGPCGPCSELHIDLTPGPRDLDIPRQIAGRNLVNQGDARCIEIWNLVFIQFNANPDGTFTDLPARHVDTGMGFERVTSMIQGTKGLTDFSQSDKISNYETDVFTPLFDELGKITGHKYEHTLPTAPQNLTEMQKVDVAFRVIADHIRTLSFSIADGISPSNEGRGYVLRRILRRAVRYGRNLGLKEPFLGKLVDVLGKTMGHIFPEVVAKAEHIKKTLTQEEESFLRTLERGILLFDRAVGDLSIQVIVNKVPLSDVDEIILIYKDSGERTGREVLRPDRGRRIPGIAKDWKKVEIEMHSDIGSAFEEHYGFRPQISGADAFLLSDTYGFPLDLTELMARERGLTVDVVEFDQLMAEQKQRSQSAQKKTVIEFKDENRTTNDQFKYEDCSELSTKLQMSLGDFPNKSVKSFIPYETQFYAAMGGQVSDTGWVKFGDVTVEITSVEKVKSAVLHTAKSALPTGVQAPVVTLILDLSRRARIEAHHSGTHLMNWALRKVLGNTITQKGSYVGPDRLRFDFSHGASVTPAELAEIEKLVNEKVAADVPVEWEERPYAEVKGDPSILQFFGDKYGETVRVVSIGDFSKELCGGTHVRNSAKVGHFKVLHESAIAAGIRRIEAVSGDALTAFVQEHLPKQDGQLAALRLRKADLGALPAQPASETPEAWWQHYAAREKMLRDATAAVAQHEKDAMKHQEAFYQKQATAEAADLIGESSKVGEIPFIHHIIDAHPADYLPFLADAIRKHWQGVIVLAAIEPGKVSLLASVCPDHTKKIQAGKIIQAIAPLVGGKGGGRPELAQGGGTDPTGLPAALEKVEEMLKAAK
jgi:alanyl-tRNA synthetase